MSRAGEVLFRHRGWVPVLPILYALVFARPTAVGWLLGGAAMLLGESLRLWAAAWIGPHGMTLATLIVTAVPGIALTMARSSPSILLSSDDLPTLGRPTMATIFSERSIELQILISHEWNGRSAGLHLPVSGHPGIIRPC